MPVGARRLSAQTDATDAAGGERGRARRGFPAGGGSTHNSLRRIGLSTFFRQSLLYMEGLCDLPGGGGRETGPKKRPAAERWKHFRCPRSLRAVGRRSRGLRNALHACRRLPTALHVCRHPPTALHACRRLPTALFDNRIGSGCTNEPFHGPPVVPTRRSHATRAAGRGKSTLASDFAPPSVKRITGEAAVLFDSLGHPRRRTTPRTRARRDRSLPDTLWWSGSPCRGTRRFPRGACPRASTVLLNTETPSARRRIFLG